MISRLLLSLSLIMLSISPLNAENRSDLLESLNINHLRGAFSRLAIDQMSKPGHRYNQKDNLDSPHSWIDGLARLKISEELDQEILNLLQNSPGFIHKSPSTINNFHSFVIPPWEQTWLEARYHEIRHRPDLSIALYQTKSTALSDREKMALARLYLLAGDTTKAQQTFSKILSWEEFEGEFHMFKVLSRLDKLPYLFSILRETLPPTKYRAEIYSFELDLAFSKGTWKEALVEAEKRGEFWHLFALNYYGEHKKFGELKTHLDFRELKIPIQDQLYFNKAYTSQEIIDFLHSGSGTPAERREIISHLANSSLSSDTWLPNWILKFPQEAREMSIILALSRGHASIVPTIDQPETQFSLFLKNDSENPHKTTALARLLIIHRVIEVKPLLEFIRSAPCFDIPLAPQNSPSILAKTDPLALILKPRRPAIPSSLIYTALLENPSFQNLSPRGQARYLHLANLHIPLLEKLSQVNWSLEENANLALLTSRQLHPTRLTKTLKLSKAAWLATFINQTHKPQHYFNWWAGELENLDLSSHEFRNALLETIENLTARTESSSLPSINLQPLLLSSSPKVRTIISPLLGIDAQETQEIEETLEQDHLLGALLLYASSVSPLPNAQVKGFYPLNNTRLSGEAALVLTHYLTLKALKYLDRPFQEVFSELTEEQAATLAQNLQRHLNFTPHPSPRTFVSGWITYNIIDNPSLIPFLNQWTDPRGLGIQLGKLLTAKEPIDKEQIQEFFANYPPSYLKALSTAKQQRSGPQKNWIEATSTELIPAEIQNRLKAATNTTKHKTRPSKPEQFIARKITDQIEIHKFFKKKLQQGYSLKDLDKSFKKFREFSSLQALGKLLTKLERELSTEDPAWDSEDWLEEVMTYLETIPGHELWEARFGKQLPYAEKLAIHEKFAERYYHWVQKSGQEVSHRWGDIADLVIEQNNPRLRELSFQWLERALIPSDTLLMMPYTYPSSLDVGPRNRGHNLWSKLGKTNNLTTFANRIFNDFDRSLNNRVTLLLLSSSNKPEAEIELMERLYDLKERRGPKSASPLSVWTLNYNLQTSEEGVALLAKFHQRIFTDPKLDSLTNLHALLQYDPDIPIDQVFSRYWKLTETKREFYLHSSILGEALIEANDETFTKMVTDYVEEGSQLRHNSAWENILHSQLFAQPERLHTILDLLLVDERLEKLGEFYSWSDLPPLLLNAAHRCGHDQLLKRMNSEWAHYSKQRLPGSAAAKSQADRFLLIAKNTPPKIVIHLIEDSEQPPVIAWSLLGGETARDVVFESYIQSFKGEYDLLLMAHKEGEKPHEIAREIAAPTHGQFKVEPKYFEKGMTFTVRAISRKSSKNESTNSLTIEKRVTQKIPLAKRWNFVKTAELGPFSIQDVWRARFIGVRSEARNLDLMKWKLTDTENLHLSFWLNRGSRQYLEVRIDGLGPNGETTKEIKLKSASGGALSSGGWQKAVFSLNDHTFPETTTHLVLRLRGSGEPFYLTEPLFSIN